LTLSLNKLKNYVAEARPLMLEADAGTQLSTDQLTALRRQKAYTEAILVKIDEKEQTWDEMLSELAPVAFFSTIHV
jgi:hypothetical protein